MILDTEKRYANVSRNLINRYRKETGLNWKNNISGFINWFYESSEEWAPATFRQYKSALVKHLEMFADSGTFLVIQELNKKPLKNKKDNYNRTSRQKQKFISQEEFIAILSEIGKRKSSYANMTANWLYTGILTGVRPIEWHESEIIKNERGNFLIIKNAKLSQRRANGEYRTLVLENINHEELEAIESQINALSGIDEDVFQNNLERCTELMYRVTRKLWPNKRKYPTLYSARHQFSADAKKTEFSKKEVAALMGHASEDTATLHYGKKRKGESESKVRPLEEEVETVRDSKKGFLFGKKPALSN